VKVVYNGIPLLPPRTGVGRYLERLGAALADLDRSLEPAFVLPHGLVRGWPGDAPEAHAVRGPSRLAWARIVSAPFVRRLYPPLVDALFRVRVPRGEFDLYHETNYVPRPFDGPTVATIYDLSLALHPDTHPEARVWFFRRDFARRLPRIDRFLVLTGAVGEELGALFGVERTRVAVTPPGVDTELFHPAPPAARGTRPAGEDGRGGVAALPDPGFLLFVGSLEPRKGLPTLFRAYAGLPPALRTAHPLVLAGPPGWKFGAAWRLVTELGLRDRVRRLGFVEDRVLAELYRRAAALAFPSVYEGFGLPVLEALASGTPVVCSDIAACAEVAGDAAERVPAGDVPAWTAALERVLTSGDLRCRLAAAGPDRARAFTWSACARRTLAVYRELAGRA
jgi:alpha-1,3-rhamnosyl/mannosyltransferase